MMSLERRQRQLRWFDLTLIALSAPVWLPAIGVVALVVLVTSGRPIFFTQQRIGRGRRPFSMVKFRTMLSGPNPIVPDQSRITPIGHLLRRTSLDELPQLFNVIAGDMSLVGPRPMLPALSNRVGRGASLRFAVRPGMTGLAQVNGRNAISWEQRLRYDQIWVDALCVSAATQVLAQTASVVVSGNGIDGHDPADPLIADVPTDEPMHLEDVRQRSADSIQKRGAA